MTIKVAINGYGRIGRNVLRAHYESGKKNDIQIVAIEPPLGERVEGLRNLDEGYIPPLFENWHGFDLLDRKRVVRPRESIEWTRRLVRECGIFAGISAGAALAGAGLAILPSYLVADDLAETIGRMEVYRSELAVLQSRCRSEHTDGAAPTSASALSRHGDGGKKIPKGQNVRSESTITGEIKPQSLPGANR